MPRVSLFALSLWALTTALAAQDQSALVRLIENRFVAPNEGDIHTFLTEAARVGLITDRVGQIVAKDVFRTYLAKNSDAIAAAEAAASLKYVGSAGVGPANGTDLECNDVAGFADTLTVAAGGVCVVNGTLGTPDLRDVYRLVLVGGTPDHMLRIATVPAGASTAPPTTLNLSDAGQRFILNGTLVGTTRSIGGIGLPDGTYYVTVASTGAYTLTIGSLGTTIPTLTTGTTGGFTVAPEVHTYRVVVGAPAASVYIEVTNQTAADTGDYFFNLGRGKGGRVLFCDDVLVPPATTLQADPRIDAELPAGTYYVFLQEFFNATANANYSIAFGTTPIASVPSAIGLNTYTMAHGANWFLYDLNLSATDHFRLVGSRTTTGTGDSIVEIMDAEMGQILHCDDSASGLAGGTLYSYADNTLPAGQYWVLARNFSATASTNFVIPWTLTGTAGLPVTLNTLGNRRTEPLSVALGAHYSFTHTACTNTPLTAAHTPGNLSLVGSDGLLRGYFRNLATAGTTTLVGTSLRMDETIYGNIMATNYAATTTASVYLSGNLGIDLTPVSTTGAYQLKGEDKIGNTHYLFLSVGTGPGFIPGPPFNGRLCLDLVTLTPLFFHSFTTDCRVNYWTTYFSSFTLRSFIEPVASPGIRFQSVSLPSLTFTNIAQ